MDCSKSITKSNKRYSSLCMILLFAILLSGTSDFLFSIPDDVSASTLNTFTYEGVNGVNYGENCFDEHWSFEFQNSETEEFISASFKNKTYVPNGLTDDAAFISNLGKKFSPSTATNCVMTFTAPYDGKMDISTVISRVIDFYTTIENVSGETSKVSPTTFRIIQNQTQIYPQKGDFLTVSSKNSISASATVKKGDKIRFIVGALGNYSDDQVKMINTITYTSTATTDKCLGDIYEYAPTDKTFPLADKYWSFEYATPNKKDFKPMTFSYVDNYGREMYNAGWDAYPFCFVDKLGTKYHPSEKADTVKTFTAPYSGTILLDTSVSRNTNIKDGLTPTTIRIYVNKLKVYPVNQSHAEITSTETKEFKVSLNVRQGDKVRIAIGSDGSHKSDAIKMENTVVYTEFSDSLDGYIGDSYAYSPTEQTFPKKDDNWSFEYTPAGKTSFSPMNFSYVDKYSREMYNADWATNPYCYVDQLGTKYHPGENVDTVKTFTVPVSGVVNFASQITRFKDETKGNGTTVRILLNDNQIYPSGIGENTLLLTTTKTKKISLSVNVLKGDKLRVVIGSNGSTSSDAVEMTNTVTYTHVGEMKLAAVTDHYNERIVVYDMSCGGIDFIGNELWSFSLNETFSFSGKSAKIGDAKLVYSSFYKGYVVLATGSSGFCAIIDYATGNKIWEVDATSAASPHSIELLPNGNVVTANSGDGTIRIYKSASGSTDYVSVSLESAHGLYWDNETQRLWALGKYEINSYKVGGKVNSPKLTLKTSTALPQKGGHDLSVDYSDSDYLWVTGKELYKFNKSTLTFETVFTGVDEMTSSHIKGFNSLPGEDMAFVRTVAAETYKFYSTNTVVLFYITEDGICGRVNSTKSAHYYKVRAWYPSFR